MKLWDLCGPAGERLTFPSPETSFVTDDCPPNAAKVIAALQASDRRPVHIDCRPISLHLLALIRNRQKERRGFLRPPFGRCFLDFGPLSDLQEGRALPNRDQSDRSGAVVLDEGNSFIVAGLSSYRAGDHVQVQEIHKVSIDSSFASWTQRWVTVLDRFKDRRPGRQLLQDLVSLSLILMNCRNITLVDAPPVPAALARAQAKKGRIPKLDFKTIHITGMGKTEIGRQKNPQSEPLLPQHIVMGHPMTYHPERPLFGKHVGTYWVPEHKKGDVRNGIVTKDYILDAPQ